jgi:hypothetical protein
VYRNQLTTITVIAPLAIILPVMVTVMPVATVSAVTIPMVTLMMIGIDLVPAVVIVTLLVVFSVYPGWHMFMRNMLPAGTRMIGTMPVLIPPTIVMAVMIIVVRKVHHKVNPHTGVILKVESVITMVMAISMGGCMRGWTIAMMMIAARGHGTTRVDDQQYDCQQAANNKSFHTDLPDLIYKPSP